jgi:single stranded DNA-binding protein
LNEHEYRLTFLGKSAEILVRYCKKGSKLFIEGRLQTRKWLNKLGHEQYTTEIIVSDFQMLSSKENIDESSHTISEPEPLSLIEKNNSFTQTEQNQYTKEEIDWDKEIPW